MRPVNSSQNILSNTFDVILLLCITIEVTVLEFINMDYCDTNNYRVLSDYIIFIVIVG